MLLTPDQIREIKEIIQDYHNAFILSAISPKVLAPEIIERLKKLGLHDIRIESVRDAYLFGQLLAHLENPAIAMMTYAQFRDHIKRNPIPLTPVEHQAVDMAQMQAGQYCKGLGNRVDVTTGQTLINADNALRVQMHNIIRTNTAESIARRESTQELKSKLGWATGDWSRDWKRIANTELQQAMNTAQADYYKKKHGAEVRISRVPAHDACDRCKDLFLGLDGKPKIFVLSDLEANGTNVGRKAKDWLPVVGTVHANCACSTIRIPAGWGFNADGDLVPGGKFGQLSKSEDYARAVRAEEEFHKSLEREDQIEFQGLPIKVENRAGTLRTWKDAQGNVGSTQMLCAYGEILGTEGEDAEPIDVFIGPDPEASNVFVVHQQNPENGMADENKAMLGFSSEEFALQAYRAHFDKPGYDVTVSAMPMDAFMRWITGTKPNKEETLESARPVLVISLEKSGEDLPAYIGAANSPAGDRNPGKGTAPNFLFNTPKRTPPKQEPETFDAMINEDKDEEAMEAARKRRRRNKHEWDVTVPVPDHVYTIELPEGRSYAEARDGLASERKEALKRFDTRNDDWLNTDTQFVQKAQRKPVAAEDRDTVLEQLGR